MTAEPARHPLADAAARRTLDAEQRVRGALRELDSQGATITFAAVAERARVSRAFLYQHAQLRSQIEELRNTQAAAPEGVPARQRAEIVRLRDELALAHGRVRELELDPRLCRT